MAIAVAVGVFLSIFPLLIPALDRTPVRNIALPGHIAVIAIFGAHARDDLSNLTLMIVGTCANIIAYSLIAFVLLKWFGRGERGE